jgi:hypothetical protein
MRRIMCVVAVLVSFMTAAAAEPFHHPYGEWREYNRDWLAACPDAIDEDATDYYGYSCFASTGSTQLNGASLPAYKLTLVRNRLDGTLDLAITVSPDDGVYDEARPMILRFGGEPEIALAMGKQIETRFNTVNMFFVADEALRDSLLAKLADRNAVTLSVPLQGVEAPVVTRFSLRGVLASIDFMATYARKVAQY